MSSRKHSTLLHLPNPKLVKMFLGQMLPRENRVKMIGNRKVAFTIFEWLNSEMEDPLAFYNGHGTVFISKQLIHLNEDFALLVAYHETVEVKQKRNGLSHQNAHTRAYVKELRLAQRVLKSDTLLIEYINWRLSMYSETMIPNKPFVVKKIVGLLSKIRTDKTAEDRLGDLIERLGL